MSERKYPGSALVKNKNTCTSSFENDRKPTARELDANEQPQPKVTGHDDLVEPPGYCKNNRKPKFYERFIKRKK